MMQTIAIFATVICSLVLSVLFNQCLRNLSPKLNLLAHSGEHRQHEKPTPLVGGLAMYCAVVIVLIVFFLLFEQAHSLLIYHYIAGASLLMIVGVLDDRFHMSFVVRIIVQIIAAMIMVAQGNILYSLGELFTTSTLLLGRFSVPLTIFAVVGVINALNMIDGLDGLAGGIGFISFCFLLIFPFDPTYAMIILVWLGALLGFLLFNFRFKQPARVFMGDAGSTLMGYTLAWILIYGSQQAVETVAEPRYFAPIFAVWVLALPLFETISLMLLRVFEGKSPFHADRGHMHHHILSRTHSVKLTVLILLVWFSFYSLLGYEFHLQKIATHIQTLIFSMFFVLHFSLQTYLRRKNSN